MTHTAKLPTLDDFEQLPGFRWTSEERDYEVLKASGHSPAMAAEIILDAQRGDKFCQNWIAQARKQPAGGSK